MTKTCKPGYYWCYTDKKCKKIPLGWHVGRSGIIEKDKDENGEENKNGNGDSNGDGGGVTEDLRKWFGTGKEGGVGGGGWDEYNTKGERTGKCARGEDDDGQGPKPKCLSKEKAAKMTKSEIAAAVKRKRKKDPVADRPGKGGKPKMVSNKIDEAKKQPDHEHSMIRSELETIRKAVDRLKSKMKGEGNVEAWVQSKITKAADYIDSAADYVDSGEHNVHGSVDEAKDDPCWKGYKQEGMKKKGNKMVPNCVPESAMPAAIDPKKHRQQQRAAKIRTLAQKGSTEGERAAAEKKTKGPKMFGEDLKLVDKILLEMEAEVLNEKNVPTNPSLWSKMKAKAKAKFDVYPSAYANGWAAKEYKKAGGGWKSVSEESSGMRYCPKCKKDETREECAYGPRYWDMFSMPSSLKQTYESTEYEENDEVCPYCGCDPCECEGVEIEEATRMPAKTGNLMYVMVTWRGKGYSMKVFFPQLKRPTRKEVEDKMQGVYPGSKVRHIEVIDMKPGEQFLQVSEAIDKDKMKCNKPKADPVGDSKTGKSHVVKACEGGKEKIIRFGQRGVKGSPARDGESEASKKRRGAFKDRHAKNIARGKMSAAYWANKVKW